jgi:predicted HAD superfamily hydrolase
LNANRWHRNQCGYRPFVLSISDVGTKTIDEKITKRQTEMQPSTITQADLRERVRREFDERYLIYIKFSATSALIS